MEISLIHGMWEELSVSLIERQTADVLIFLFCFPTTIAIALCHTLTWPMTGIIAANDSVTRAKGSYATCLILHSFAIDR